MMHAQTTQEHQAAQAQFAVNQGAERKRLIKLCNVAKSDRQWMEDEWALIKRTHGGEESLKDMDIAGLEAVLAHAKACGVKVQHKQANGKKSRPIDQTDPARKLRKLWLRGHALGIIKSADESALCGWASNSRHKDVTALLQAFGPDDWKASIERLKKWLYRELQQGRLHCAGHQNTVSREAATALIWEKPVRCECGLEPVWRAGRQQESRGGRRG